VTNVAVHPDDGQGAMALAVVPQLQWLVFAGAVGLAVWCRPKPGRQSEE
jgi:hypothetical protein